MNETTTTTMSTISTSPPEFYEPTPIHPNLWVPPPAWLMFPKQTFNSLCVTAIEKTDKHLIVYTTDQKEHIVEINNLDDTWKSIRRALAHGFSGD